MLDLEHESLDLTIELLEHQLVLLSHLQLLLLLLFDRHTVSLVNGQSRIGIAKLALVLEVIEHRLVVWRNFVRCGRLLCLNLILSGLVLRRHHHLRRLILGLVLPCCGNSRDALQIDSILIECREIFRVADARIMQVLLL